MPPLSALLALALATRSVAGSEIDIRVAYDYGIWFSTVAVIVGTYVDLRTLGWSYSFRFTLLLSLCGALTVLAGRVASLAVNSSLYLPYEVMPLFGSRYTRESFLLSLILVSAGTSMSLVTLSLHSALGRPIVFRGGRPVNVLLTSAWGRLKEVFSIRGVYL